MRRFINLVTLCLLIILMPGCDNNPQPNPPVVPSPQPTLVETNVSFVPTNALMPTATPTLTDTQVSTNTPAPAITPVLLTPAPNPGGLEVQQFDYYDQYGYSGNVIAINFVGVVKNNSDKTVVRPTVSLVLKDAQGNIVAKDNDDNLAGAPIIDNGGGVEGYIPSSMLDAGQQTGFSIQLVSKPSVWATAEITAIALPRSGNQLPDEVLYSRPDIKVVNPQTQVDDVGDTNVHGELVGATNNGGDVRVVAVVYNDAGKVLDVGSYISGSSLNDTKDGKHTFDVPLRRSGLKIARYEFSCFSYQKHGGATPVASP